MQCPAWEGTRMTRRMTVGTAARIPMTVRAVQAAIASLTPAAARHGGRRRVQRGRPESNAHLLSSMRLGAGRRASACRACAWRALARALREIAGETLARSGALMKALIALRRAPTAACGGSNVTSRSFETRAIALLVKSRCSAARAARRSQAPIKNLRAAVTAAIRTRGSRCRKNLPKSAGSAMTIRTTSGAAGKKRCSRWGSCSRSSRRTRARRTIITARRRTDN